MRRGRGSRSEVVDEGVCGRRGPVIACRNIAGNRIHQASGNNVGDAQTGSDISGNRIADVLGRSSSRTGDRIAGYAVGASAGDQPSAERVVDLAGIDRPSKIIRAGLGSQRRGKDARSFVAGGHGDRTESGGRRLPQTFVVGKKVQLVFDDGAADRTPELVAVEGRLVGIIEIVPGVIGAVPVKLPGVAVDLIRPRL